jgi:hypothetical protein
MDEKKEESSGWDISKMKTAEPKKVEETVPVVAPISEAAALKDLSSDGITQVIVKKKRRLFDRSKNPMDYTLEELEIVKQQKIEEERLAREKAADEATLASMRAEKKAYYEYYRKFFSMNQPHEVRMKAFVQYFTDNIRRAQVIDNKSVMMLIQSWMELFGLKLADKKHVFTDQEFEEFFDRCKTAGVYCPYDLFIKRAREQNVPHRETAVADQHRRDLYNQV